MRLTPLHACYFAARRLPVALALMLERPSIDALINAHAAPDTRRDLPKPLQRPGAIYRAAALRVIASDPLPSRDKANARKWLHRLENANARRWWIGRAGLTGAELTAYDRLAPAPGWSCAPVRMLGPLPELTNPDAVRQAIVSHRDISDYETREFSARRTMTHVRLVDNIPRSPTGRPIDQAPVTMASHWRLPRG